MSAPYVDYAAAQQMAAYHAGYFPPASYTVHQSGPHLGYGGQQQLAVQRDASGDELRTLFITGFPSDVKERELNNMMRFLHGYQASQMNWKNGQAQGFALFDTGASAVTAISLIAHIQFDESSVLRAEIARKNMFVKDDGQVAGVKRQRVAAGSSYPPAAASSYPSGASSYPPTTYASVGVAGVSPVAPKAFVEVSNVGDNQPCSTLFVGNLSDDVADAELQGLFVARPGFRQIKVVKNARNVTAFVEFEDLGSAIAAHASLQGAVLDSSNRGGIRIQFSKNPLGKRRDRP